MYFQAWTKAFEPLLFNIDKRNMLSHSFIFICANPPLHTVHVYHTRVMLNSDYHMPVSVHSEIRSAFNKDDVPTFVSACTHF